jgi:hypothetical protein
VAQLDPESGAYLDVSFAQSTDRNQINVPFSFNKPTKQVQDALQTNQLFLVAVNDSYFSDTVTGATFNNIVYVDGWKMAAQLGKGTTPTSYRNVMILKFCTGTLEELVSNPNRWTKPGYFSLVKDSPDTIAYTGLSKWLQDYIERGKNLADGSSANFYQNFKKIVTDPEWRGIIVLEADLSVEDLPPQIKGLAAGIQLSNFTAHHFGFTVSRVSVDPETCVISIDKDSDSSIFGLVDYKHPIYAMNLDSGMDPNSPINVQTSEDFDFTVLQLQCLFENSKLVDFESYVHLTVNRLFASQVAQTYGNCQRMPGNGIVMKGSYVNQNEEVSYVFQQTNPVTFILDSNVLQAIAFDRIQFNTMGKFDNGATIKNRFLIWGSLDFVELKDKDGELLDIFSFGSQSDTLPSAMGKGLSFSNLIIDMNFPVATPSFKSFTLNPDNLAYDLNASSPRDDSLFKGFGLQLKSFINASGDKKTPADYGFLPVTSTLKLKQLNQPWFGVVYDVTLGGPGALASAVGFSSSMLIAWAPSTTAIDAQQAVFIGLSLPGAAPGAKLFSIQGLFKVAVGSIALLRQPIPQTPGINTADDEQFFYCLRLDDIGVKVFGIAKLPPDANIQMFLFGDPKNMGSLGWYAAYVSDDKKSIDQERLVRIKAESQSALPAGGKL